MIRFMRWKQTIAATFITLLALTVAGPVAADTASSPATAACDPPWGFC